MTARPIFAARRDPCELAAPDPTLADVLAAVNALRADLARFTAEQRLSSRYDKLSAADRGRLALLFPSLAEIVRDLAFTSAELVERAALPDQRLAAAIAAAAGNGKSVARRLGCLLSRAEGLRVSGMVLEKIGQERDGAVWQLRVSRVATDSHGALRRTATVR